MTDLLDDLAAWIPAQRWFAGKSRAPRLRLLGELGLRSATEGVAVRVLFVVDEAEHPLLYQVPVTERREPLADAAHLVASRRGRHLYDGPHDPAYAEALLRLMLDQDTVTAAGGLPMAHGDRRIDGALRVRDSRVLGGEQSNTSIVYETATDDDEPGLPVICKVFRTLHDGENPEVVLTAALGAAGSGVVPRPVGSISGSWPDAGLTSGVAHGHLAVAQEFLPGAPDAWRVATAAVAAGEDFSESARTLGEATAAMHAALARELPTRPTTPRDVAAAIIALRARFDWAARRVPALEAFRGRVAEAYSCAADAPWPSQQRVHGDLHLGQVLSVPGRGWVALDFEGEPLRPLRERSEPDSPLRDVAGMLRSFDYAGSTSPHGAQWARAARDAFLAGYSAGSGLDLTHHGEALAAFELDKALYEAVYEAQNRPEWLRIPLDAVERLTRPR